MQWVNIYRNELFVLFDNFNRRLNYFVKFKFMFQKYNFFNLFQYFLPYFINFCITNAALYHSHTHKMQDNRLIHTYLDKDFSFRRDARNVGEKTYNII